MARALSLFAHELVLRAREARAKVSRADERRPGGHCSYASGAPASGAPILIEANQASSSLREHAAAAPRPRRPARARPQGLTGRLSRESARRRRTAIVRRVIELIGLHSSFWCARRRALLDVDARLVGRDLFARLAGDIRRARALFSRSRARLERSQTSTGLGGGGRGGSKIVRPSHCFLLSLAGNHSQADAALARKRAEKH